MAVVHTDRVHVCALAQDRKTILEELQRAGVIQVEPAGEPTEVFLRKDTSAEQAQFERAAATAERALKVLGTLAPERRSPLAALEGRLALTVEQYDERTGLADDSLALARDILDLRHDADEARSRRLRAEASLEALAPWMPLDVPLSFSGTKSAAAWVGALPGRRDRARVLAAIAAADSELVVPEVEVVATTVDQTCVFVTCPRAYEQAMDAALRSLGFVRPPLQSSRVPAELASSLRAEADEAERAAASAEERIRAMAPERPGLCFAADYYRMRADKYEVLGELLESRHAFFLVGYVPKGRSGRLAERLESTYCCAVELEDASADEEAPVLLRNARFVEPTEAVVEAFGLPGRGEIDPTTVMAPFYYLLFGLMLSDAGYGLVMMAACVWAVRGFPGMEGGLKKMLHMFFWCGLSTTFWGILFGSYFGDVVSVVGRLYAGAEVSVPALWFAPLDDPMRLLMFSFGLGLVHLFVGLGIKGYMLLRDRRYLDFVAGVVAWYALLFSLLAMLLPSDIFASMSGATIVLPAWAGTLAGWVAVISAAFIVLFSQRGASNWGVRVALGAYDLYGISSWLSDVLSYSRLLALGLATGVIATVINTMAAMLGTNPVGLVLFWVVFLVGHALNMAINLLGAYVHTNRLQFVEFFGKFYEGGGRPFRPFSAAANKYFKIKEEA